MLTNAQPEALGGLDLSLQPVGEALKRVLASVHVRATVPTPVGPVPIDSDHLPTLRNVSKTISDAVRNTRVELTAGSQPAPAETPIAAAHQFVEANVPGGWVTVALGGVLAALAFKALAPSRSSSRRRTR